MRLALDTNRYSDLAKGDAETRRLLESAQTIFVPFIVLAELRAGFLNGGKSRANEEALTLFLLKPGVETLLAGEETTRVYARLYRQLKGQDTPIPGNDLWIASLVVEHNLSLCTRDRHFEHLPQIEVV